MADPTARTPHTPVVALPPPNNQPSLTNTSPSSLSGTSDFTSRRQQRLQSRLNHQLLKIGVNTEALQTLNNQSVLMDKDTSVSTLADNKDSTPPPPPPPRGNNFIDSFKQVFESSSVGIKNNSVRPPNCTIDRKTLDEDIRKFFLQNVGSRIGETVGTLIVKDLQGVLETSTSSNLDTNVKRLAVAFDARITPLLRGIITEGRICSSSSSTSVSRGPSQLLKSLYREDFLNLCEMVQKQVFDSHIHLPIVPRIFLSYKNKVVNTMSVLDQEEGSSKAVIKPSMLSRESFLFTLTNSLPSNKVTEYVNTLGNIRSSMLFLSCQSTSYIINQVSSDTEVKSLVVDAIVNFVEKDTTYSNVRDFSADEFRRILVKANTIILESKIEGEQLVQKLRTDRQVQGSLDMERNSSPLKQYRMALKSLASILVSPKELTSGKGNGGGGGGGEKLYGGGDENGDLARSNLARGVLLESNAAFKNLPLKAHDLLHICKTFVSIKQMEKMGVYCQGYYPGMLSILYSCLSGVVVFDSLKDIGRTTEIDRLLQFKRNRTIDSLERKRRGKRRRLRGNSESGSGDGRDDDERDDSIIGTSTSSSESSSGSSSTSDSDSESEGKKKLRRRRRNRDESEGLTIPLLGSQTPIVIPGDIAKSENDTLRKRKTAQNSLIDLREEIEEDVDMEIEANDITRHLLASTPRARYELGTSDALPTSIMRFVENGKMKQLGDLNQQLIEMVKCRNEPLLAVYLEALINIITRLHEKNRCMQKTLDASFVMLGDNNKKTSMLTFDQRTQKLLTYMCSSLKNGIKERTSDNISKLMNPTVVRSLVNVRYLLTKNTLNVLDALETERNVNPRGILVESNNVMGGSVVRVTRRVPLLHSFNSMMHIVRPIMHKLFHNYTTILLQSLDTSKSQNIVINTLSKTLSDTKSPFRPQMSNLYMGILYVYLDNNMSAKYIPIIGEEVSPSPLIGNYNIPLDVQRIVKSKNIECQIKKLKAETSSIIGKIEMLLSNPNLVDVDTEKYTYTLEPMISVVHDIIQSTVLVIPRTERTSFLVIVPELLAKLIEEVTSHFDKIFETIIKCKLRHLNRLPKSDKSHDPYIPMTLNLVNDLTEIGGDDNILKKLLTDEISRSNITNRVFEFFNNVAIESTVGCIQKSLKKDYLKKDRVSSTNNNDKDNFKGIMDLGRVTNSTEQRSLVHMVSLRLENVLFRSCGFFVASILWANLGRRMFLSSNSAGGVVSTRLNDETALRNNIIIDTVLDITGDQNLLLKVIDNISVSCLLNYVVSLYRISKLSNEQFFGIIKRVLANISDKPKNFERTFSGFGLNVDTNGKLMGDGLSDLDGDDISGTSNQSTSIQDVFDLFEEDKEAPNTNNSSTPSAIGGNILAAAVPTTTTTDIDDDPIAMIMSSINDTRM